MYSNIAKTQAFPFVTARVYPKPSSCYFRQFHTLKPQSMSTGSGPKPLLNPICVRTTIPPRGINERSGKGLSFAGPVKSLWGFEVKSMEMGNIAKAVSFSSGFRLRSAAYCCCILRARNFSSSSLGRVGRGSRVVGAGKSLPWLSSNKVKELKGREKGQGAKGRFSSRDESLKRLEKGNGGSSWEQTWQKLDKGMVPGTDSSSWEKSAKSLEKGKVNVAGYSREDLSEQGKYGKYRVGNRESESRMVAEAKDGDNCYDDNVEEDTIQEAEEGEEVEVDDPRWDKIKDRVEGMVDVKGRNRRPESQRWNKQENWGRKIWKEATESTIPKMVGEGVYGIGPVLAALSAGRREFYSLYVQEGLDLSSNNRKKKDKKGFEKALKIAQKIGLSIKEVSKHDLNMVVASRPHQGLVLDASALEMVKIGELDAIVADDEKCSLWVALDEVTDPQNLGAIIRSAYFFGASGIVLCAKNSAPLSAVVSKASAGSLEVMELRYCKNMMQFLISSAENGWRVLGGSVSSRAVPLKEVAPGEPTILVLGSEGTGLRPLVERSCTQLVRITGNIPFDIPVGETNDVYTEEKNSAHFNEDFRSFLAVESLNVSVAAGVLLHHLIGSNCKGHTGYIPTDVPV